MRIRQGASEASAFVEVANTNDVNSGRMKSLDVKGRSILVANVDGKFYAMDDRCGHMNAMLSMGKLTGKIVVCPFHFAEFDVTTGEKVKDPCEESFGDMSKLPEDMQKFIVYAKKLVDPVRTYDMQTYEVKVEEDKILVRL